MDPTQSREISNPPAGLLFEAERVQQAWRELNEATTRYMEALS